MSEKTLELAAAEKWLGSFAFDSSHRGLHAGTIAAELSRLRASLAQAEERVKRARADAILEVAKMALEKASFIVRSAEEMAERLNKYADAQELIHKTLVRAEGARHALHDFSDSLDPLITAELSEARMPGKG